MTTKTRLRRQHEHDAPYNNSLLDFDPFEHPSLASRREQESEGFPFTLEANLKVLGVILDDHLTMDANIQAMLSRAQLRQGILAKMAKTTWGLETGVLRITHNAIITSLLRYALTLIGSTSPDDLVNRIDAAIINAAARKVTGLPTPTRIGILHLIADTQSFRNLFIQHCAIFLHQCLTCHQSFTQEWTVRDLCAIFKVQQLHPLPKPLAFDIAAMFIEDSTELPTSFL